MPAPVPPPVYRLFVGTDIAAASATSAWMQPGASISRPLTTEQTPAGQTQLLARLRATGVAPADTLVVMEATGSYWITLATALHAAGYAVSVINPMQAHHFAKALYHLQATPSTSPKQVARVCQKLMDTLLALSRAAREPGAQREYVERAR